MNEVTWQQFTNPDTGISYRWKWSDVESLEIFDNGDWAEVPFEDSLGNLEMETEEQQEVDDVYALVKQWGFPGLVLPPSFVARQSSNLNS